MVNPFDHNFMKFFLGFACILGFSFGILYLVGQYSGADGGQNMVASK